MGRIVRSHDQPFPSKPASLSHRLTTKRNEAEDCERENSPRKKARGKIAGIIGSTEEREIFQISLNWLLSST